MLLFEEFVERSQRARTIVELGETLRAAIEAEGYENFVLAEVAARQLKSLTLADLPDGYAAYYRDQKWDRIDPVLALSTQSRRPFYWRDALPRTLEKRQLAFLSECKKIGVHSGITIPFHGPGNRVDLLSISRRHKDAENRKRFAYLYAVAAQTWQRSLDFTSPEQLTAHVPPILSAREYECLAWSRDGLSYSDIADKLQISRRTVDYHMTNAQRKLGATDKVTAVVKAIHFGLL